MPESDNPTIERGLATKERPEAKKPRMYKVLLHNDDYTTMEFVVHVLMQFFRRSETEATQIMLTVHHKGKGVAGVYTRDTASTKATQVIEYARENQMPLMCTVEPE